MSAELQKYFNHRVLPDENLNECWDRIIVPPVDKRILMNYAKGMASLNGVSPVVGAFYRSVLFLGDKGTGKSTLARGYANQVAKQVWSGRQVNLFELRTHSLFSEWEGRSSKELAQAFELVRFSARHNPTILIADEVESLAYDRRGMIQSNDPTDLIRAVDTLLNEMDQLRFIERVLFVATSNFPEVVDEAVWDRFDIKIRFKYPEKNGRAKILIDCFEEFSKAGLSLDEEDALLVAQATEGLSPRAVKRGVLSAQWVTGKPFERLSVDDIIRAARDLVLGEKAVSRDERRISDEHD